MKTFLKCSQKVHVWKMEIGDRRKPSEYAGNCRNVRKFPNRYKETLEKGIPFCIFKFILAIFNNGQIKRICICIGSKIVASLSVRIAEIAGFTVYSRYERTCLTIEHHFGRAMFRFLSRRVLLF